MFELLSPRYPFRYFLNLITFYGNFYNWSGLITSLVEISLE
jgi:hypothetical protein